MNAIKKIIFGLALFILFGFNLYSQCAMCKVAAESDLKNNPNSLAKGINSGILYLMVIPYILVAFFFRKEIIQFLKGKRNK